MNNNKINKSIKLCTHIDEAFNKKIITVFDQYCALIQEWNKYSKLVSAKDAQESLPEHCADSISLVPIINSLLQEQTMEYWDLGTGGGFPAIPICMLLPDLPTRLIERNTKKCTFLHKACNRLDLNQVSIDNTSFTAMPKHPMPRIFTSRAIEKPELVLPEILASLSSEDVYLCQSESIHSISPAEQERFHVEPIDDEFSKSGLRRNKLYRITKK